MQNASSLVTRPGTFCVHGKCRTLCVMRLEVLLNTIHGPYAFSRDVLTRDEACDALRDAFCEAFGNVTEVHETVVARFRTELRTAELPHSFRANAVAVTLNAWTDTK